MTATLANASASDRPTTDFYETPDNVTDALLRWLNLPRSITVWEPACGRGKMARRIESNGYSVISTTLETGQDFLAEDRRGDWIITNPPFSLASQFIHRAIALGGPFAFLLKSQFWHAATRLDVFRARKPRAVLPLTWRPDFLFGAKGGAPTMECLWTVWDAMPSKDCIYEPLKKP